MTSEQTSVKGCKEGFTKKNVKTQLISDDVISLDKKVIYKMIIEKFIRKNLIR